MVAPIKDSTSDELASELWMPADLTSESHTSDESDSCEFASEDLIRIREEIEQNTQALSAKEGEIPDHLVEGPLSFAWPTRPAINISHIPLFNGIGDLFDTTEPPHPTYVLEEEQSNELEVRVEDEDETLLFLDELDHSHKLGLETEDELALSDFFSQIRLFLLVVLAEVVFWAMLP